MAKKETKLENTESKAPALSQEEFEFISKDQPITQEQKAKGIAEFKEQAKPVFKAAEQRMVGTDGVATLKPVKPLTVPLQEPKQKYEVPTTLPDHGIRGLYTPEEQILDRATQITGLPPESPANHYIANTLAKGDPFSAASMEAAKEETMKLVRAGIIPNPDYEGFGGFLSEAVDVAGPIAVEIGLPVFTGIVSSPLLLSPEPFSKAYWVGLQASSSTFANLLAQQMRISSGMQKDTSYMEAAAAGAFGLVPGITPARGLSKTKTALLGAAEGGFMAGGEDLTRQGLQILFEEREGFEPIETLTAVGVGSPLSAGLKSIGRGLDVYDPKKDPAAPILRKALQDRLKEVKKELQRTEKRGAVNVEARDKIKQIEDKINALKPDEDRVLQQAIDRLDEAEQKQAQEVAAAAQEFQQSEAAKIFKEADEPTVAVKEQEAPTTTQKPQEEVNVEAKEIVDDFMSGGGTRDVDPETGKLKDSEDEVKARLLTSDTEKQRLINSVTRAIDTDLKNVKGGRVGKLQYLAKVQQELNRRLGKEAGDEFALVMKASQVSDNAQVADAIDQLGVHMAANGAIMVQGFDDVLKFLDGADLNNKEVLNNAMVSIHKLIPAMMGWKKAGSASGRLLQSRKYEKDIIEIKQEHLKEKLEGNLVSSLKEAKDLNPEQLEQQIKTFGDIQVVKKLLQAVQQAEDISEVKDILIKQQEAFQSKSAKAVAKKLLNSPYEPGEGGSIYTKVRDIFSDAAYASMLSSPVTHAKVAMSNKLMSGYNVVAGAVGAKYMATVPWSRNGLTRQQFEEAGAFWTKVASSYGNFSEIANKEALRVLKTGDADLQSHFERIGESALSMERTGLTGAFGQTVENVGRFVDIPGKAMAAVDVRTRLNIAHSMTRAKAEMDYIAAKKAGEDVGTLQDYYDKFVAKVFNESKTKMLNEDQVRRKAVLMAEQEGVKAEDLASYIDNFVKDNWNKNTSSFVDFVNRNLKEVTFTEEIGEFADPNVIEKGSKHIESFLKTYPFLHVVLNPFMRTGRNITRGAMASTSSLVSVANATSKIPGVNKLKIDRIAERLWSKTAKDLASDDPIVVARAKGQQIVGAGVILAAIGLSEGVEDVFEFVGTESQDWKKKKNIKAATGMPEYTLRVGKEGEKVAISLAALEPLNTILSITADMKTLNNGTVAQREEARGLMEAAALAITNNIANKSYYKNLGDAIKLVTQATDRKEATRREAFKLLKSLGSTVVPSAANTLNYMSDDVIRENNTLLQVIARRMNGLSKLVPPMRDIFGDVQTRGFKQRKVGGLALLSPFGVFTQKGSVDKYVDIDSETGFRTLNIPKITRASVRKEIAKDGRTKITPELLEEAYQAKISEAAAAVIVELGGTHHFNGGTSKWEKMDLEEIIHPETQQNAFDRWQELTTQVKLTTKGKPSKTGKTLKEMIVTISSQTDFKKRIAPKGALPERFEQEDKRLDTIRSIFKGYRDTALGQLQEEYPILMEDIEARIELQKELSKPADTLEEQRELEKALPGTEFPLESYKKTQRPSLLEERLLPFRN
jgi:GGDEF domain-containing protein